MDLNLIIGLCKVNLFQCIMYCILKGQNYVLKDTFNAKINQLDVV